VADEEASRDRDGFAPLRSYGVLGNGRSVALAASDGSIDWCAVPRLDDPPVCAALLDPQRGGRISLAPTDPRARSSVRYVDDTNLLETTWETPAGSAVVVDSLNSGNAGALPWAELARRVEGRRGAVEMALVVAPGDGLARWQPYGEESHGGPLLHAGPVTLAVRAPEPVPLVLEGRTVTARFRVTTGERLTLAVVAAHEHPVLLVSPDDVDARVDLTERSWRQWSQQLRWNADHRAEVLRSGLALKTLLMAGTGAIAAAATTSLPERVGGPKNWDYRYSWVRDTALTVRALNECGLQEEVHAALLWLLETIRVNGPGIRVLYTLDGGAADHVSEVPVPGYRGSTPVRIGNDAVDQLQLGVYGELFDTVAAWVAAGHILDRRTRRELVDLANGCADTWLHDDSGLWELSERRPWTVSKMNAWRALDAAARLASEGHLDDLAHRWRTEAYRIRRWVGEHCWCADRRTYTAWAGSQELDAAVLLGGVFGFDRGDRMSSTIDAIGRELGAGPLVYRLSGYQSDEATFVACAYWRVGALAAVGRLTEAHSLMLRLRDLPGPLGLLSEMAAPGPDGTIGELLGNVPQALSHLAQIDAATMLAHASEPAAGQREESPR
jgi:GH15 family glucan-1,4-alpha-glucosidase